VSDYARLSARTSHPRLEESDLFLTLHNPLSDPLAVDWKISFPFPVTPNRTSGKTRLEPYAEETISWTTDLARLSVPQRQAASEREIAVELGLSSSGTHFQDGVRSTLKELRRP